MRKEPRFAGSISFKRESKRRRKTWVKRKKRAKLIPIPRLNKMRRERPLSKGQRRKNNILRKSRIKSTKSLQRPW